MKPATSATTFSPEMPQVGDSVTLTDVYGYVVKVTYQGDHADGSPHVTASGPGASTQFGGTFWRWCNLVVPCPVELDGSSPFADLLIRRWCQGARPNYNAELRNVAEQMIRAGIYLSGADGLYIMRSSAFGVTFAAYVNEDTGEVTAVVTIPDELREG